MNESISKIVTDVIADIGTAQVSGMLKLLMLFGAFFLLSTVAKTGGSIIELLVYVVATIKWAIMKLLKKDI